MIITCPNCKRLFKIDDSLIPEDGRDLQCGSCNHVWFYKVENEILPTLKLNQVMNDKEIDQQAIKEKKNENKLTSQKVNLEKKAEKSQNLHQVEEKSNVTIKKEKNRSKFFSYLIVFILSLVAIIILIDTIKKPLVDIFPGSEILLFNLYETLQDIKLFIIDLF